jgi:hypothetical protein
VAVPIFEQIIQAAWQNGIPRVALSGPSAAAGRELVDLPIDPRTGERLARAGNGAFIEHFHVDRSGQVDDTQYRLVSREEAYPYRDPGVQVEEAPQNWGWSWNWGDPYNRNRDTYQNGNRGIFGQAPTPQWRVLPPQQPPQQPQAQPRGWFGNPFGWWNDDRPRPRRIDPDYPGWGRRLN